jgi:hypothetical protein
MVRKASWLYVGSWACCILWGVASAATLPPPPPEPELARYFSIARDELSRASSLAYFVKPKVSPAWPCAVDESVLRGWGGALGTDEMEPRLQRIMKLLQRDQGVGSRDQQIQVRDVHVGAISAQCLDGKLSGEVDYRVDYVQDWRDPSMTFTSQNTSRVHAVLVDGELAPSSPLRVSIRTTGPFSSVSVTVTAPDVTGPSISIVDSTVGSSGRETSVSMHVPGPGGRAESRQFRNGKLASVGQLKGGRLHGLMETFEDKVGGIRIPPSKRCYEDGELLKTPVCNVD